MQHFTGGNAAAVGRVPATDRFSTRIPTEDPALVLKYRNFPAYLLLPGNGPFTERALQILALFLIFTGTLRARN